MEFIKLLKAGSIISGINWSIYLIHEWVHFAMNNPPEVVTEGNPVFLGLIAQSLASLSLIGFGILYKSRTASDADGSKTIPKPRLTAPPTNFSKPTELPVTEIAKPQNTVLQTTPPVTPRIEPGFASPKPVIEPAAMSPAPKAAKPLRVESQKSDHRLLILLLLIVGMIASAIYFIKQKPADEPEAIVKTPTAEEKPSDPQPQGQPQPAQTMGPRAHQPIAGPAVAAADHPGADPPQGRDRQHALGSPAAVAPQQLAAVVPQGAAQAGVDALAQRVADADTAVEDVVDPLGGAAQRR